jgi:hypothetical protein
MLLMPQHAVNESCAALHASAELLLNLIMVLLILELACDNGEGLENCAERMNHRVFPNLPHLKLCMHSKDSISIVLTRFHQQTLPGKDSR